MPNLNNQQDREKILTRLGQLEEQSQRQWGSMEIGSMLAHLIDAFMISYSEKKVEFKPSFMSTAIGRWLIFRLPLPKGKIKAPKEFHETDPIDFHQDLQRVKDYVRRFEQADSITWGVSPAFGHMGAKLWGQLHWIHTNHHLKQFGC